ncbi:MAG: hypothetical protein ACOC44_17960 [Promethearchaeia archaeon]
MSLPSYPEIIEGDKFDKKTKWRTNTDVVKMCWGCEKKFTTGFLVYNTSKGRRFFLCEDCYKKIVGE